MFVVVTLAVSLVILTFLFHHAVLRWLSGGMAQIAMTSGVRILVIVVAALAAHLAEVSLYAVAYALGDGVFALGSFGGLSVTEPLDYLYFSIVSYTSLGLGDVFPADHLRFITGVEALNGLLLIAWSGSFIYIAMGRLWPWQTCAEPARATASKRGGGTAS
ncbi:MAG: two pore domain potassium channel family protein [Desulfuromonadales bacterium]|nr:two pore domain potassium channel family protein [Desulfuromonadales bacterium]